MPIAKLVLCTDPYCPICTHQGMDISHFYNQIKPTMRTADQASLTRIATDLASFIAKRDAHYKASWKQRGGIGAYFTIVRPMDRFHAIACEKAYKENSAGDGLVTAAVAHDIFGIIEAEDAAGKLYADGTLSACVKDLAAYMLLIMEEMEHRKRAGNYSTGQYTTDAKVVQSTKPQPGDAVVVHDPAPQAQSLVTTENIEKARKALAEAAERNRNLPPPDGWYTRNLLDKVDSLEVALEMQRLTHAQEVAKQRFIHANELGDWKAMLEKSEKEVRRLSNRLEAVAELNDILKESLKTITKDKTLLEELHANQARTITKYQQDNKRLLEDIADQHKLVADLKTRIAELESKYVPSYDGPLSEVKSKDYDPDPSSRHDQQTDRPPPNPPKPPRGF